MSVDLFFGAPLVVEDVEPAVRETINSKVSAFLESGRARETITKSPEESVATSFYRSDASIIADAGLDELEAFILKTARAYLEETLKLPPRKVEIEHAWINIFDPGSQEGQHEHDGSLLSCSYYVEAPEDCGCIVFPDPIGARRSYREFTKTAGQELLNRREIAVEPKAGRLVMFESWMPHYIQCNKTDKVRISIAINLRTAPETAAVPHSESGTGMSADGGAAGTTGEADLRIRRGREGEPFLFNDVFDVNTKFEVVLESIHKQIPTIVIDDFLADTERAREVVGHTPATNWKNEPGGRNFVDYYDCRLRFPIRYPNKIVTGAQQAIHRIYGLNTRPADPSVDVNWFMQINPRRANFAVPHADITDTTTRSFTCIIYLNRREECSGGTAFFRFRPTDSLVFTDTYAQAVDRDPRVGETGFDYWPEATLGAWEQEAIAEMIPGRLLIFPSQFFHSAYHPEDSFFDFPRLTLAFWMIG